LRVRVLGDAPLTLEYQPVVLGDADRGIAGGRRAEDEAVEEVARLGVRQAATEFATEGSDAR
jgi:hypothetical protein